MAMQVIDFFAMPISRLLEAVFEELDYRKAKRLLRHQRSRIPVFVLSNKREFLARDRKNLEAPI